MTRITTFRPRLQSMSIRKKAEKEFKKNMWTELGGSFRARGGGGGLGPHEQNLDQTIVPLLHRRDSSDTVDHLQANTHTTYVSVTDCIAVGTTSSASNHGSLVSDLKKKHTFRKFCTSVFTRASSLTYSSSSPQKCPSA